MSGTAAQEPTNLHPRLTAMGTLQLSAKVSIAASEILCLLFCADSPQLDSLKKKESIMETNTDGLT
jgi:hypothetical protein